MCEPAGEIPPDPDFARGVSLKLEGGVALPDLHIRREPDRKRVVARPLEGLALGDERVVVGLRAADRPGRGLRLGGHI